jgi:hypothetical protein
MVLKLESGLPETRHIRAIFTTSINASYPT